MKMVSILTSPCQTDIKGVSAKGGVASRRLLVSLDSPQRHSGSAEKRQQWYAHCPLEVAHCDLHGQTDLSDTTRSFPRQIISSVSGRIPYFLRVLSHRISIAYCTDAVVILSKLQEVVRKPVSLWLRHFTFAKPLEPINKYRIWNILTAY